MHVIPLDVEIVPIDGIHNRNSLHVNDHHNYQTDIKQEQTSTTCINGDTSTSKFKVKIPTQQTLLFVILTKLHAGDINVGDSFLFTRTRQTF